MASPTRMSEMFLFSALPDLALEHVMREGTALSITVYPRSAGAERPQCRTHRLASTAATVLFTVFITRAMSSHRSP